MTAILLFLIAVDTVSNTAESEKTSNLIDDPDRDVTYHCLREYFFHQEMLLINHDACHMLKFFLTVGQFCKRLLQKHETVPFTRVNVAALVPCNKTL